MKKISFLRALPNSLEVRIIVSFVLIMLTMAIVLDVMFITIQKNNYTKYIRSQGQTMARLLAQSVKTAVFSEDRDLLKEPVANLLKQENIKEIVVITNTGKLLLDQLAHHRQSAPVTTSTDWPQLQQKIRQSKQLSQETPDYFTFWWPVLSTSYHNIEDIYFQSETWQGDPPQEIGHVAIVVDKKLYHHAIQQILLRTGAIIALLASLAIIAAYVLIRRLTAPLRQLLYKISPKGQGQAADMDILQNTVLSLVEDLDSAFTTIKDLRDGLELKVAERTQELSRQKITLQTTISELQDAQANLVQSEKMAALGQMVAGVAHEINNTINFISASLPSLHRALATKHEIFLHYHKINPQDADTKKLALLTEAQTFSDHMDYEQNHHDITLLLAGINEGTNRTIAVVSALQSFSRSNAKGDFSPIIISEALESTLLFIDKKKSADITIKRDFAEDLLVDGQLGPLHQVFLNIINNSFQSMRPGGTLTITTLVENDQAKIIISDTGQGIPAAILPKIFDPFFTTKEVGQGTGLGLSISYQIIKDHHGDIIVSTNKTDGTTFTITLPLRQPPP